MNEKMKLGFGILLLPILIPLFAILSLFPDNIAHRYPEPRYMRSGKIERNQNLFIVIHLAEIVLLISLMMKVF